jgi:antitoxin MazE
MDTKIQKWGNSLAVRIPKAYAVQMGLFSNSPVKISLEGERLVIVSVRRPTLAELLADVTPDNLHDETDWGEPVGNEVW